MKNLFNTFFLILILSGCSTNTSKKIVVLKDDLRKIGWIEGNWKGMYEGKPFYELYKLKNDSTLEITSYTWTGTDSTGTSRSSVYKRDGSYYLGDSLNWKVTAINDSSIFMKPNYKAYNSVLWKRRNKNGWDAILISKSGERVYNMEKVNHFKP